MKCLLCPPASAEIWQTASANPKRIPLEPQNGFPVTSVLGDLINSADRAFLDRLVHRTWAVRSAGTCCSVHRTFRVVHMRELKFDVVQEAGEVIKAAAPFGAFPRLRSTSLPTVAPERVHLRAANLRDETRSHRASLFPLRRVSLR